MLRPVHCWISSARTKPTTLAGAIAQLEFAAEHDDPDMAKTVAAGLREIEEQHSLSGAAIRMGFSIVNGMEDDLRDARVLADRVAILAVDSVEDEKLGALSSSPCASAITRSGSIPAATSCEATALRRQVPPPASRSMIVGQVAGQLDPSIRARTKRRNACRVNGSLAILDRAAKGGLALRAQGFP